MFHSLKYSVTFPTGRTLSQDIDFEGGFWAITGPNEIGKSFVFEMLRFALFGSQALRGVGDDYKTLVMSAEFSVKGVRYAVERTMKKATFSRGGEVVATGVSVVNEKIGRILGFGMLVFDTACCINQGEIEALGNMGATDRKRMVDQVLGIDALDIVAKWGAEEARVLDREVETFRRTLQEPVLPEQPTDYIPTDKIDLEAARGLSCELHQIDGFLSAPGPAEPTKPVCPTSHTVEALQPLADEQVRIRNRTAELTAKFQALPVSAPYSNTQLNDADAEWERFDRSQEAQRWLQQHPQPKARTLALEIFGDDYVALDLISEHARLLVRIETLKAAGSKPCPHCGEDILLEQDAIEELEAKLPVLPSSKIETPPFARNELPSLLAYARSFDEAKWREMSAVEIVDLPIIKRELISSYRQAINQVVERARLAAELSALPAIEVDYEDMLRQRRYYDQQVVRYDQDIISFTTYDQDRKSKQTRRLEIADAHTVLQNLQLKHKQSEDYEQAMNRYGEAFDAYHEGLAQIETLTADADRYRKVRQLMDVLRTLIKQHLMPSLNKVASHLLSGMTGGQRQLVYVDEEFNVIIDGQRLDTLSGSGKACANLALRIALGQVLTNRIMSVLLADEIDASMDDFRAEQTSNILWMLVNSISQVLLISHKSIETNNIISLGGFGERERTYNGEAAGNLQRV